MKTKSISTFLILTSVLFTTTRCQHADEDVIPVKGPTIEHGTEQLACSGCTPLVSNGAPSDFSATNVPSGTWYFDKSHSNVMWETPYKMFGSTLTGRFNYFVLENLTIDEATPSNTAFAGYVYLNSVNTGEPGRDGGCLLSTYGTDAAKTNEAENVARLESIAGSGKYSTTDNGFIVNANLTFHGVTKQVTVKLFYFPQTDEDTYTMAGVSAEFDILALTDFAIQSDNIDDQVKIRVNCLMRNKK